MKNKTGFCNQEILTEILTEKEGPLFEQKRHKSRMMVFYTNSVCCRDTTKQDRPLKSREAAGQGERKGNLIVFLNKT